MVWEDMEEAATAGEAGESAAAAADSSPACSAESEVRWLATGCTTNSEVAAATPTTPEAMSVPLELIRAHKKTRAGAKDQAENGAAAMPVAVMLAEVVVIGVAEVEAIGAVAEAVMEAEAATGVDSRGAGTDARPPATRFNPSS